MSRQWPLVALALLMCFSASVAITAARRPLEFPARRKGKAARRRPYRRSRSPMLIGAVASR